MFGRNFVACKDILRGAMNNIQHQIETKRFRFYKDQKAQPLLRKYGFNNDIIHKGLLPRNPDVTEERLKEIPLYVAKDSWNRERALFGQNDYIDILGEGDLEPRDISYNVPAWIRGFRGNEYQMLLRKMKKYKACWKLERPTKYKKTKERIDRLFYILNYRRKVRGLSRN